jgi:hypothetical protein
MKAFVTICLVLILGTTTLAQAKKDPPKHKNLDVARLKLEDEGYLKDDKYNALLSFVVEEVINENTAVMAFAEARKLKFIFKIDTKNLADGSLVEPSGVWKVTGKEKKGSATLFILEKTAKR